MKNEKSIVAIPKFDVPMECIFPRKFQGDLPRGVGPLNICDPLYSPKNFHSVYKLYGAQNDRLELMVSTQKSVLTNIHRVNVVVVALHGVTGHIIFSCGQYMLIRGS